MSQNFRWKFQLEEFAVACVFFGQVHAGLSEQHAGRVVSPSREAVAEAWSIG